MRRLCLLASVAITVIIVVMGCGSGGSSNPPMNPMNPTGTVTVTFANAPVALAVQMGTGPFMPAVLQNGTLTLNLPTGTTNYSVAFVCPPQTGGFTFTQEIVYEANVQDGTALTSNNCSTGPANGSLSGNVDASAVPGATDIAINGFFGFGGFVGSNHGSFNVNLPLGPNDIAVSAIDASHNALAVRILRNQTVPGAINGGNPIVLGSGDLTSHPSITVSNLPASFMAPTFRVVYFTSKGTALTLDNFSTATQYPAVPSATVQSGDFYSYQVDSSDTATLEHNINIVQDTTTGGGAVTLGLPAPWAPSSPVPAAFPTFTFNYSGFAGLAAVADFAAIEWSTATTQTTIEIIATANFQNGATTITVPNLTSMPGFIAPPPSGTVVFWNTSIYGGPEQETIFFSNRPPNGSLSFVQNGGTYTEP